MAKRSIPFKTLKAILSTSRYRGGRSTLCLPIASAKLEWKMNLGVIERWFTVQAKEPNGLAQITNNGLPKDAKMDSPISLRLRRCPSHFFLAGPRRGFRSQRVHHDASR